MNSLIVLGVVVAVIGIVNGMSILVRKFRSSYLRHRPMYIELNPFFTKIRPNRRHLHDIERSKSPDSRATDGITDPPWGHSTTRPEIDTNRASSTYALPPTILPSRRSSAQTPLQFSRHSAPSSRYDGGGPH